MRLQDFPLLTDENIDPEVVAFLRAKGFEVKDVKESGLQGSEDRFLIDLAYAEGRVIITEDSDFSEIIFTERPDFVGVIHFRPGSFFSAYHVQTISVVLNSDLNLEPPFIISAENKGDKVRVRVRNALPGPAGGES